LCDHLLSLERLKIQTLNSARGLKIRDTKTENEKLVKRGEPRALDILFELLDPLIYLEWLKIQTSNFACRLRVGDTKPKMQNWSKRDMD